ncbi:MAG: SPOR domain-containing protein [Candidatus Sumerlaeaceae bacterium]
MSLLLLCTAAVAAPNDGTFKVRVARDLKKEAADSITAELKKEGYTPVDIVPSASGFTVLVGAARTKQEAQVLAKDLKSAGFTTEDIEEPAAAGATAGAGAPAVSADTSGGTTAYRVLVHEFPKSEQAEQGKENLKAEGFTNVDITPEDGKYKLYVGTFPQQSDAQALLSQIKGAGFAMAQVATIARRPDAKSESAAVPPPLASLPANLSASQKSDAQSLLDRAKRADAGEMSYAEYQEFVKERQRQSSGVKMLIAGYEKDLGEKREIQNKTWSLYREFDNLLESRRYDAARRKLDEVRAVDPKDAYLPAKQERLSMLMGSGGGTGAPVVAQGSAAGPRPNGPKPADPEAVQQMLAEARKAEGEGRNEAALARYNKVYELDATHVEARSKIAELNEKLKPQAPAAAGTNQKLIYGGGGLLVVVILALAYWNFVNGRREKKLEQQVRELAQHGSVGAPAPTPAYGASAQTFVDPLAPGGMYSAGSAATAGAGMSGMGAAAMGDMGGSGKLFAGGMDMPGMGAMIGGAEDESDEREEKPAAAQQTFEAEEVGHDEDVVSLSSLNFDGLQMGGDEPDVEVSANDTAPVLPPPGSDSLSLGDLDLGFGSASAPSAPSAPTPVPAEPVNASSPSMSMPDLDLDALLKGTFPGASAAAPDMPSARIQDISPVQLPSLGELTSTQEERSIHDELTLREMNAGGLAAAMGGLGTAPTVHIPTPFPQHESLGGGSAGGASQAPVAATSTAPAAAANASHHEQTFDQEPVGSQPANWTGDYEYASLTVDDQNSVDGTGRCLKFEKRSGAGSASYHCNFPNASGQVTVEFDIRCDDKNKYLLGFYVEKDEDFKQSVHTIVHRIDSRSQPSLRIQGEPVPYELGSWRRVKYELNLLIGVVNAFVDEQHVVKDAKLPTIPAYVNTLSIRDNLATTGLFYLDNIRITRR